MAADTRTWEQRVGRAIEDSEGTYTGPVQMWPAPPVNRYGTEDGSGIPYEQRLGRCYELAARFHLSRLRTGTTLVHGSIHVPGEEPIGHAWVETTEGIYEPLSNSVWPRDTFMDYFHAVEDDRYPGMQALDLTIRTMHTGPWRLGRVAEDPEPRVWPGLLHGNEDGSGIGYEDRKGHCYDLAGAYQLRQLRMGRTDTTLVHGSIHGFGEDDPDHADDEGDPRHAWVEMEEGIYEPLSNRIWPKEVYVAYFHPVEHDRYPGLEALDLIIGNLHVGRRG